MTQDNYVEILLVEDNQSDADLAKRALTKYKLANRIIWVKDGEEALDLLFNKSNSEQALTVTPRLILLDLKLPKVDGMEVLKAIRSSDQTRHIPVVMLTSSKEENDIVESYKLGVNSYIVKPVDFNQFIDAVKDIGKYWLLVNEPPQR